MPGNRFLKCAFLLIVGITTVSATSAGCDAMFEAVVSVRGQLGPFFARVGPDTLEAFKQRFRIWTKLDMDDDIALRQAVCKLVSANSLEEMASTSHTPILHFNRIYSNAKADIGGVKAMLQERLSRERVSEDHRRALLALLNMLKALEAAGILRFTVPPAQERNSGCDKLKLLARDLDSDRHLIKAVNNAAINRLKAMTGIDLENLKEFNVVICKLGEVRSQVELANVLDLSVSLVQNNYQRVITYLRSMEDNLLHHRIPDLTERISANLIKFLRGMQQVGIYELPAE